METRPFHRTGVPGKLACWGERMAAHSKHHHSIVSGEMLETSVIGRFPVGISRNNCTKRAFLPRKAALRGSMRPLATRNLPQLFCSDCATAASAAWNPIFECVPSQKGLFTEPPQRQREIAGFPVRSHSWPFASTNRIGPSTRYGPLGRTVIVTGESAIRCSYL